MWRIDFMDDPPNGITPSMGASFSLLCEHSEISPADTALSFSLFNLLISSLNFSLERDNYWTKSQIVGKNFQSLCDSKLITGLFSIGTQLGRWFAFKIQ
jgi:hypothetical protein